jgi:ABC-type Fe2+-enterobactin transport system substrate-binding protein
LPTSAMNGSSASWQQLSAAAQPVTGHEDRAHRAAVWQ